MATANEVEIALLIGIHVSLSVPRKTMIHMCAPRVSFLEIAPAPPRCPADSAGNMPDLN
jgi:hypothetical protein